MALTDHEIALKVRDILTSALGVEEELVVPTARLTDDLGAESIDYLDIAFQLEKAFGITIKPEDMLLGDAPNDAYLVDGKISDAGIAELRRRLPHASFDTLNRSRSVQDFRSLFTVAALTRYVATHLSPDAASDMCAAEH